MNDMNDQRRLKVLLVDDHAVVCEGLAAVLGRSETVEVVGQAGSAGEAIARTEALQPDVVVMDIRMPGASGIDACREIVGRWPGTRVLMLTSYADDEAVLSAILAGASGYVLKQVGSSGLLDAIERVGRGESMLDPGVTRRVLEEVRTLSTERDPKLMALSDQERRILALIADGRTNKEIAAQVFLSEKTVRNYVSGILSKLDLSNRAEAAAFAVRKGMLQPGSE